MHFFGLKNWKVTDHEESKGRFLVRADYDLPVEECVHCKAAIENLCRHGRRARKVRDFPIAGKPATIELTVQRYRCLSCHRTFTQHVAEIADHMRITVRFAGYIARQCAEKTFASVSRDNGLDVNTVREIFTTYMDKNESKMILPTPRHLGIDGVYVRRVERCIMTDLEKKRFFGLYEKVNQYSVEKYLQELPDKENVEAISMDMSRALRNAVEKILPQAKIVIDKYHVIRLGRKVVDNFLKSLKNPSKYECRAPREEPKDYSENRFLLYSRRCNHSASAKKQLKKWGCDVSGLVEIYKLKEEFINLWQFGSREKAEKAFEEWKNKIPAHLKFAFKEILTAFRNWGEQIFNYFDCRVTNAFTESTNRGIKMIQKTGQQCSFWTVRAKMLCRAYHKLTENEKALPRPTNNYSYIKPKKHQRVMRLKQSYEHSSEVFALMFPKVPGWHERFGHYYHLFCKT
jgi:transposase